jgi:hypothetical protein
MTGLILILHKYLLTLFVYLEFKYARPAPAFYILGSSKRIQQVLQEVRMFANFT